LGIIQLCQSINASVPEQRVTPWALAAMTDDKKNDLMWCSWLNRNLGTEMLPADLGAVPELWLGVIDRVLNFRMD